MFVFQFFKAKLKVVQLPSPCRSFTVVVKQVAYDKRISIY